MLRLATPAQLPVPREGAQWVLTDIDRSVGLYLHLAGLAASDNHEIKEICIALWVLRSPFLPAVRKHVNISGKVQDVNV